MWLCVVSHFQLLREVAKLGISNMEHVQPFENEDDSVAIDEDYPTKQESLDYNPEKQDIVTDADHPADEDAATTLDDVEHHE